MKRNRLSYAGFLLVAVASVSAVRYTGVFGEIASVSLVETSALFVAFEIATGAAMGLLEGLALEYILRRIRRIEIRTTYWWISVVFACLILVTFPVLTTPYVVAVLSGASIAEILNGLVSASPALWLWSLAISSIIPIVVAAIGVVRDDDQAEPQPATHAEATPFETRRAIMSEILDRWSITGNGTKTPTVMWLINQYRQATGEQLPAAEADAAIVDWRAMNGVTGRRPAEPEPMVNGVG